MTWKVVYELGLKEKHRMIILRARHRSLPVAINLVDWRLTPNRNGMCLCDENLETVEHIICECHLYDNMRKFSYVYSTLSNIELALGLILENGIRTMTLDRAVEAARYNIRNFIDIWNYRCKIWIKFAETGID